MIMENAFFLEFKNRFNTIGEINRGINLRELIKN